MTKRRVKKMRKKRMRSFRKINLFLWAFGMVGLVLGVALLFFWVYRGPRTLQYLGLGYVLVSGILFGIRGVLVCYDDQRKRRHDKVSNSRHQS